jgi:hypothetical protein
LKHFLFLPSLIALLVKESGAISAARIGSREAFNALMAVWDRLILGGSIRKCVITFPYAKFNRNTNNAAKVV